MVTGLVVAYTLALGGAQRPKVEIEYVVARPCIRKVELTPETECRGADITHLRCTGMMLTYGKDCVALRVSK